MRLIDRGAETIALHGVLERVHAGKSAALVLRGEPGVGKSALLAYALDHAGDVQVVRTVGVESEKSLGYAAVHHVLVPFLHRHDRLPARQRQALGVAFGLADGPPPDPFLVGLAVLTLLAEAARHRPVLWVIDDAQWLDEESAAVLGFVARRLLADPVGMLFAARESVDLDARLAALPELRIAGLPPPAAAELLAAVAAGPVDAAVSERIVVGTGGNPLAIVEVVAELTAGQLRGQLPLPEPLPVGHELEELYVRRVRDLPADTQTLVLLAASVQPGHSELLWRAAAALGVPESAAAPAAAMVRFSPEVYFSRPLVRSAVYHASEPDERRRIHRALAAACDGRRDAGPRAWHLAAAAAGPDEAAAAELAAAAEQLSRRGGYAAAAALLERAAVLSSDEHRQAERQLSAVQADVLAGLVDRADALLAEVVPGLHDPLFTARATRLQGRIRFHRGQVAEASSALVCAARGLRTLDPPAARDALLSALEATVFAGWAPSTPLLEEIVWTARNLGSLGEPAGSAANLLLRACVVRLTEGYPAAVPFLRPALQAFLSHDAGSDVALQRLELAAIMAADLFDDTTVEQLTTDWIHRARERGALARLAGGLAFRGAFVDATTGSLPSARAAEHEARELGELTGNPAIVPPTGAHTLLRLGMAGREEEARAIAAAVDRDARGRGAAGEMALAASFVAVLEISLGNYRSALDRLELVYADDTPLVGTRALPDMVEAAVRTGSRDPAERALHRLAERASATGTPLALGLLARSRALLATGAAPRPAYEEALHLLGRTAAVPQLARTHLLYGEWLRRQRRPREAREPLRTAHDMFDAMGLIGFAERARAELLASGEHIARRETASTVELTAREAQIATLVSRGEANRDIAAHLFVTPNTVEYHLRKVFRKLGVSSRTQLARRVLDDGLALQHPIPVPGGHGVDADR